MSLGICFKLACSSSECKLVLCQTNKWPQEYSFSHQVVLLQSVIQTESKFGQGEEDDY